MLFADVTFSTESMVVIGTLGIMLTGAIGKLFAMLVASKDDQLKEVVSQAQSYREMASEAIDNLEMAMSAHYQRAGKTKPAKVAPVTPEHSSPVTVKQQDTADLQTMRARLVAATLGLDLPARLASRAATKQEESAL